MLLGDILFEVCDFDYFIRSLILNMCQYVCEICAFLILGVNEKKIIRKKQSFK